MALFGFIRRLTTPCINFKSDVRSRLFCLNDVLFMSKVYKKKLCIVVIFGYTYRLVTN